MSDDQAQNRRRPAPFGSDGDGDRDVIEVLGGEHDQIQGLFARVSGPDEDRRDVLKQLVQALSNHLAMEKHFVVSVLKKDITGGAAMAEHMTGEHDRMEHLLTLVERRKVNSPDLVELLNELLELSSAHASYAAETIFPALRRDLSADQRAELGRLIVSEEREGLMHSHPALPDAGPVAVVARKAAAIIDGLRDRSVDIGRTSS